MSTAQKAIGPFMKLSSRPLTAGLLGARSAALMLEYGGLEPRQANDNVASRSACSGCKVPHSARGFTLVKGSLVSTCFADFFHDFFFDLALRASALRRAKSRK